MTPSAPIIHTEHLGKEYRGRPALVDLNFNAYPGQIIDLVGPSNCGKTTLLGILVGVLANWSGTVTIDGKAPGVDTKRHITFLSPMNFPNSQLAPPVAVKLCARLSEDLNIDKALFSTRFSDLPLDRRLKEISKSMEEKLQIYLTMARRARLYLLDEPVSGVGPVAHDIILEGILRDFGEDASMFISAHPIFDVESVLDEAVILEDGRVHCAAPADDLREECGMSLNTLFRKRYR